MHNEAVTKLDHAVSAPHASFKDNRVTLVLRFIDRRSLKHLTRQIRRMEKAAATAQAKAGGTGCVVCVEITNAPCYHVSPQALTLPPPARIEFLVG